MIESGASKCRETLLGKSDVLFTFITLFLPYNFIYIT